MYMKKYPCVYMRGGTSKAVFFHEKDLPEDKSLWDDIFLKVMGTPDVKQINGFFDQQDCDHCTVRQAGRGCGIHIPSGGYRDSESGRKCKLRKHLIGGWSVCD